METKSFYDLYPNRLKIDDFFSLTKSSIDYASPVKESLGKTGKAILVVLETDNKTLGLQIKKGTKSPLTAQVTETNQDCDNRIGEVKRNVSTHLQGLDPDKKAAAEALKIFLNPYWKISTKALNTQISLTKELFAKFNASETLKAQAASIGITEMMAGLETANNALSALYQTRNEQVSGTKSPSASSLKSSTVKTYEQFCIAVEQAVNYTPSDVLSTLFNQMDELRKTYARLPGKKSQEEASPAKVE